MIEASDFTAHESQKQQVLNQIIHVEDLDISQKSAFALDTTVPLELCEQSVVYSRQKQHKLTSSIPIRMFSKMERAVLEEISDDSNDIANSIIQSYS